MGLSEPATSKTWRWGSKRAYTNGVGYLIALGGLKVSTTAETSPTVSATLGAGAAVTALGNAYNMSITEDNADPHAKAIGIPIGAPDSSTDQPTQTVELGAGATLTAQGTNVIEPYHNQHIVPTTFTVTNLGPNAVSSLGNKPPTITSPNTATVAVGSTDVLTVMATDPQNYPLTYAIMPSGNPSLFKIGATTGKLSFLTPPTASGSYVVVVVADDGKGGVDSQTITVTVSSPLTLVAGADAPPTARSGGR